MPLDKSKVDFALAEFENLRREVDSTVKEIYTLERYSLATAGAIWSWYAANATSTEKAVVCLPFLLGCLFAIRCYTLYRHLFRLSGYLTKVEKVFELPEDLGWERYLSLNADWRQAGSGYLFWLIFLSGALMFPLIAFK